MIVCTITTDPKQNPERFGSFFVGKPFPCEVWLNDPNIGVVPAMQKLYENNIEEDIICYVHDDVTCFDLNWAERVRSEFDDPKVAVCGFGGATGIGTDWIYRERYKIEQLQRINYASNDVDWPIHGTFEEGSKDVATVDGFFIAVRTSFLREIGGFKWMPMLFHNYDNALALMAHRKGYKVRMVGCKVHHHGGSYSASPAYKKWCLENGTTMEREHEEPHRWMYDFFRDELPLRIG